MKHLFALISTEGKSLEQIKEEVWGAYQKYQQAQAKSLSKSRQTKAHKVDWFDEDKAQYPADHFELSFRPTHKPKKPASPSS